MVINPDGSFAVTGVMKGGSLYESNGTIKVENNKVSLVFEGDKDVTESRLELVAGKSLSYITVISCIHHRQYPSCLLYCLAFRIPAFGPHQHRDLRLCRTLT